MFRSRMSLLLGAAAGHAAHGAGHGAKDAKGHGHGDHGDHGHGAAAHGAKADHGHDDHGHGAKAGHGHDGHDDHGHGHDDHGHGHDDHGHHHHQAPVDKMNMFPQWAQTSHHPDLYSKSYHFASPIIAKTFMTRCGPFMHRNDEAPEWFQNYTSVEVVKATPAMMKEMQRIAGALGGK